MNHVPVMVEEVLEGFADSHLRVFVDGTVGKGGHAKAILEAHPEIETYIACDRDPVALSLAKETLKEFEDKVVFVHTNFLNFDDQLEKMGIEEVNGFFLT